MAEDKTFDSNRRLLLSGFGALGVLSLSACCRLAIQEIKETHKYNGSTPFSPSLIQKSELSPKLAIDAHTHFFNAADVPVKEFMQGPVAHALPSKITKDLIYLIAPTVSILSKFFSLSPAKEINMLDDIVKKQTKMSALDFQIQLDRDIETHERELAKALAIALKNTPFEKEYLEASKKIGLNKVDNTLTENSIYEAMKFGTQSYGLTVSKQADIQNADNPDGVFAFVKCMLSPRHHNLQNYIKAYATNSNAFGVDACLGALVDFNYWLSCPSNSSSIRDQVLLHERLAVLSGGYLLPLVPYNPWTDIKNNRSSLNDIVWAIKEHGFVGVKIYPPMGFYPSGNEDIPAHPNK